MRLRCHGSRAAIRRQQSQWRAPPGGARGLRPSNIRMRPPPPRSSAISANRSTRGDHENRTCRGLIPPSAPRQRKVLSPGQITALGQNPQPPSCMTGRVENRVKVPLAPADRGLQALRPRSRLRRRATVAVVSMLKSAPEKQLMIGIMSQTLCPFTVTDLAKHVDPALAPHAANRHACVVRLSTRAPAPPTRSAPAGPMHRARRMPD